jgi:SAM-dependent methyltransferase
MAVRACRVCGRDLPGKPSLRYAKMPKAAQHLPDAASLAIEAGVDLEVCQCTGCGLVQLSNDPVPYYREVIRAAAVSDVLIQSKREQFASFVQQQALRGKRILEVGCGCGEFLSLLQPLDVTAFGLEYSESAVAECVKNGLCVSRGYPDRGAGALPGGPFDAFLLLMFLEHMPEPNVALQVIHDNLTDNAVGLVEVPNFDMVLRKKLFAEFTSDHLLYFTGETLRTTLHLNGFEVVESAELRNQYVLSLVVRKRGRLDVSAFRAHQERITADIKAYVSRFGAKRVAVWGAGHQALAILALTGVADSIRYVVDSAPFKQGRYTPATHVPIVAPEALHTDPVDAVIVMAASYSDEVAGIIRRELDRSMAVAVLRDFGLEMV